MLLRSLPMRKGAGPPPTCYNKDGQPTRVDFLLINRPALAALLKVEQLDGKGSQGEPDLCVHRALKFTFAWTSAQQEVPAWRRPRKIPLEIEGRSQQEDEDLAADIKVQTEHDHAMAMRDKDTTQVFS